MADHILKKYRFLFFILISIGIISGFSKKLENLGSNIVNSYKIWQIKQDLILIKTNLDLEKSKQGLYPPEHRFSHWFKENLSKKFVYNFPIDRLKEPYIYKTLNKRKDFFISSSGKDKIHGTKDDIVISSIK